jgi:membrane-bound serine protease (ClpP class)
MALVLAQASSPATWSYSPFLAVFLVAIGLAFVVIEIFPPPTFGVFLLCALGAFAGGIWIAFNVSTTFGAALVVAVVLGLPLVAVLTLKVLKHTRMGKRLIPDAPKLKDVSGTGAVAALKELQGRKGRTMSMCRPSGTANFDGERYDVVAEGLTILDNRPVKVVRVEGNRVIVRETE